MSHGIGQLASGETLHKQRRPGSLVSVIVPVFNDRDGLLACLTGLREQETRGYDLDVIAVDNGSSPPLDATAEYPIEVRIVRCETPGSYAARNAGVEAACGDFLAFTDADCTPEPGWIAMGVDALRETDGKFIVGGEVELRSPEATTGTALYQIATGFQQMENIQGKGFTATANMFCTVNQFCAIGPFDERLLSGGDREWCWRAAKKGIAVRFESGAIVRTVPRVRLKDAIRQARRVAAGRKALRELTSASEQGLQRHRTPAQSVKWIASLGNLSVAQRCRMLGAALTIRLASMLESLRLRFGLPPERR